MLSLSCNLHVKLYMSHSKLEKFEHIHCDVKFVFNFFHITVEPYSSLTTLTGDKMKCVLHDQCAEYVHVFIFTYTSRQPAQDSFCRHYPGWAVFIMRMEQLGARVYEQRARIVQHSMRVVSECFRASCPHFLKLH